MPLGPRRAARRGARRPVPRLDEAAYITGTTIVVDGARSCKKQKLEVSAPPDESTPRSQPPNTSAAAQVLRRQIHHGYVRLAVCSITRSSAPKPRA